MNTDRLNNWFSNVIQKHWAGTLIKPEIKQQLLESLFCIVEEEIKKEKFFLEDKILQEREMSKSQFERLTEIRKEFSQMKELLADLFDKHGCNDKTCKCCRKVTKLLKN